MLSQLNQTRANKGSGVMQEHVFREKKASCVVLCPRFNVKKKLNTADKTSALISLALLLLPAFSSLSAAGASEDS